MKATHICLALLLLGAGTAQAQSTRFGYRGWGPRLGLSFNPDQVHFGMHADFGDLSPRLRFQPNFELGVGDHHTVGALNFEANYRVRDRWNAWTPYFGGGVGILFINHDISGYRDVSDTESGLSILGGIEKAVSSRDRFFMEAKLGLMDAPDLKFSIGWTFGR